MQYHTAYTAHTQHTQRGIPLPVSSLCVVLFRGVFALDEVIRLREGEEEGEERKREKATFV